MTLVSALQAALATEHEVVYGYGAAGAHLSDADEDAARAGLLAAQRRRDALQVLVRAAGSEPVAALPAYALPSTVTGPTTAKRLAAHLEVGAAGAAWDLVAASPPGSARDLAVSWVTDAAVRAAEWGTDESLPGRPL